MQALEGLVSMSRAEGFMEAVRRNFKKQPKPLTIVGAPPGQRVPQKAYRPIGVTAAKKPAFILALEDGQDLSVREIPPTRWVIKDLLPEGIHILAGKPKQGKSFLAMDWALAIVNGESVFGQYPVEQGQVLYLNLDDPSERRLQDRQRALLEGRNKRGLMWCWKNVPTLYETPGLLVPR
jgi:hypothetical protein